MLAETFVGDLRIGLRALVKERSFCALAVVVLALGISGVTTMFSVVNGVMLRGFSFPNARRLASATFIDPTSSNLFGFNGAITAMDYEELRPAQQSFERLAAYLGGSTVNVTADGRPRRYQGAYVTDEFLKILGVMPAMGRDFTAADNVVGAPKVTIIGHGLWQRDFGGAPDIVGRVVRVNGKMATIVGVMPTGFAFPTNEELWIPLYSEFPPKPRKDPSAVNPSVVGLLKPGVTLDQANAEFTKFARQFAAAYPDSNKQFNTGQVQPLLAAYTPAPLRGTLWTMLAFCVGVLLIACVNVMNMQFARATLRAKELAIRSSLGAGRVRLIRQMLTESLQLAGIGTALGLALATLSIDWLSATVRSLDVPPPSWMTFDMDPVVLAATVGATIVATVASGLLPAWMSSRASAAGVLRDAGRGTTSRRVSLISRALVVVQIVVTCVLLIGAILQARSIVKQQDIDYGYDTAAVMSARMGLMEGDYPSPDARKQFYDRLLLQLRADPAFVAVGLTNRFRMVFSGNAPIEIFGRTYQTNRDRPNTNYEQVTTGLFEVTDQRLLEGRPFSDDDVDSRQPVAIVNEAFARKHFGRESAIGRQFRTTRADGTQPGPWRMIVGVVTTVRMLVPFNIPNVDESGFYVPFYANPVGPATPGPFVAQFATVAVTPRPGQSAESLANALRQAVAKADPNLPLYYIGTARTEILTFVAQNRIIATMFSIFGVVAVVLASVGIYGVMSFSVSQRTQEFGVRMALGASARKILGLVVRQGAVQIAVGLVLGIGLSLGLAGVIGTAIQTTLFGVTGRDPLTYGVVIALVTVVSLAATFVPARRATRVDPNVALRIE